MRPVGGPSSVTDIPPGRRAVPDGTGANTALDAMVVAVLGSILLHGGGSPALARALRGKARPRQEKAVDAGNAEEVGDVREVERDEAPRPSATVRRE
ncbi:hypothetical protein [Streptomyces sp. NRRL S-350]|uniref:hypothetical protein n=1 Tax=Streptomyces sp. NRRL S-350 TaxID=1463902 RepID=UPI0004C1C7BF|nr:hypothetical protein [Streptomyces sp. NRRL S-350]